MLQNGSLQVLKWNRIPVRVHLLAPLGWFLFNRLDPIRWLAMVIIVFLHEAGHAWVVRRFHARVVSIDFMFMGGECQWRGEVSKRGVATIAWGGVAAQALLLLVAWPLLESGLVIDPFFFALVYAFVWTNLLLIGINLLPIPPLDGSRAWAAIPLWVRHWRSQRANERHRDVTRQLTNLDRVPPATDEVRDAVTKLLEDAKRDLRN
ncbi:MAG: hypothetical protein ABTQ32_28170 [Myxococcaceae bacterium]